MALRVDDAAVATRVSTEDPASEATPDTAGDTSEPRINLDLNTDAFRDPAQGPFRLGTLGTPDAGPIGGFTLGTTASQGVQLRPGGFSLGATDGAAAAASLARVDQAPPVPTRLTFEQLQAVDVNAIMTPPEDGTSPLMQHPETKGTTDSRGREITNRREHVVLMEQLLNAAEGKDEPITGEYSERLAARVLRFQKNNSLGDDSITGPKTMRRALELALAHTPEPGNPVAESYDYANVLVGQVLRLGDRGEGVAAVKRLLTNLDIPVDLDTGDVYTEQTAAAVSDLQERLRIATGKNIQVDGKFGYRESLPNALWALEATRTNAWAQNHPGEDGPRTFGEAIKGLDERMAPIEVRLTAMPSISDVIPRFAAMTHGDGAGTEFLQRELQKLGYDIADDGDRGPATRAAEADVRDIYTILSGNELPDGIDGTRVAIQHMLFPEGPAQERHDPNAVTLLHTLPEYMRAGHVRQGRGRGNRVVVRMMAPAGEYTVNWRSGGEGMLQTRAALSFVAMRGRIRGLGMREEFRSGWRSYRHQAHLYEIYAKRGGVARAGGSAHHDGEEADFVIPQEGGREWLVTNADDYGFYDPKHRMRNGATETWAWKFRGRMTDRVTNYWRVPTNPRPTPQPEASEDTPMTGGFDIRPRTVG